MIAEHDDFAKQVSTLFIEDDSENYARLEGAVAEFYEANKHIRQPVLRQGRFAEVVSEVLDRIGRLAPTFLFIDPCGIRGASFDVISRVMKSQSCEAFVFFNLDAVRRVAGLDQESGTLVELYGSKERTRALRQAVRNIDDPPKREDSIIDAYRRAIIDDMHVSYVAAFRVESESRRTTSHYFVHATQHPLGFAIMKDVMWPRGRSEEGKGGLEFLQATDTAIQPLFLMSWSDLKQAIVHSLGDREAKVDTFYDDWVRRQDDMYCETAYRQALIELEREGRIEVIAKDGSTPVPAETRRKRRGQTTLGKGHYVRLPRGSSS